MLRQNGCRSLAYFPYFRGKQFELILVRECAQLMRGSGFIPVIEPVKESTSGLKRAVDAVSDAGGEAILILNPQHGFFSENNEGLERFFADELPDHPNIGAGIILSQNTQLNNVIRLVEAHPDRSITMIHAGFPDARILVAEFGNELTRMRHIFWEEHCGKIYQKHFRGAQRILLRDGFKAQSNRNYDPIDFFSDLHVTFDEEGMNGFSDFSIVGKGFSETGGPAYAVAIHITCIDPENEDTMFVHHFVSIRKDTPTDPAGKFAEALQKLEVEVRREGSCIEEGEAIREFLDLGQRGHYPGLGTVKKLSMKHHLETLSRFFTEV